jgi:hypothetical protein
MSSEIASEVSAPNIGGDKGTSLSSVQSESFKGFESFSSIKSAMTDTTSSALPGLELSFDTTSGNEQKPNPDTGREKSNPPAPADGAPLPTERPRVGLPADPYKQPEISEKPPTDPHRPGPIDKPPSGPTPAHPTDLDAASAGSRPPRGIGQDGPIGPNPWDHTPNRGGDDGGNKPRKPGRPGPGEGPVQGPARPRR